MVLMRLPAGLAVSLPAYVRADSWGHMDGWSHMGGWGAGFGVLLALLLLAVVGAVVAAVVALSRTGRSGRAGVEDAQSAGDRARTILAERYARGEIGTDEYRERLHELG